MKKQDMMPLRRLTVLFAACILALSLAVPTYAASLNAKKVTMNVGKTYTLKLKGSKKKAKWTTSNKKVATVSSSGKVSAKKAGKAIITATVGKAKYSCNIVVKQPVTAVKLSKANVSLKSKGATYTVKASVKPSTATNKGVAWKSSNTKVAKVNSSGKITAVANGSCTITATAKDGSKKYAKVNVKVSIPVPKKVTKISLGKENVALTGKGSVFALTVHVSPDGAANKELSWSTSDPNVATIEPTGVITSVGPGTCTITATAQDGSKVSRSCNVVVKAQKVTKITLSQNEVIFKNKGEAATLTAEVSPANADNQAVKWVSSNKNIATVDQDGTVTAVGQGSCKISACATDGSSVYAACVVKSAFQAQQTEDTEPSTGSTESDKTEDAAVESFLCMVSNSNLEVGNKVIVKITDIEPAEAAETKFTYSSSDGSVLKVSADGTVTAVGIGDADIIVKPALAANKYVAGSIHISVAAKGTLPTETPATGTPVTETPATSTPATETPSTETPVTETPSTEAPVTEPETEAPTEKQTEKQTDPSTPAVESFICYAVSTKVEVGQTTSIVLTSIEPSSAANAKFTYSSTNTSVATVDANGTVTAVSPGTAQIVVLPVNPKYSYVNGCVDITVTTRQTSQTETTATEAPTTETPATETPATEAPTSSSIPVESFTFSLSQPKVEVGSTVQAQITDVIPANATDKTFRFTSADESIATVGADGKVLARKPGKVEISAVPVLAKNSYVSGSAYLTVTEAATLPEGVPVEDFTVTGLQSSMMIGDTATLVISGITPSNATDTSFVFDSSDKTVATIDKNGVITAVSEGTSTITVKPNNPSSDYIGYSATVKVTPKYTNISNIDFRNDEEANGTAAITKKMIAVGGTKKLSPFIGYTITGSDNGIINGDVVYSSSDTSVATVSQDGTITGVSTGYATITVKTVYPTAKGVYVSAKITYRIGAYTADEILANLTMDEDATQGAHDYFNLIRTTPSERILSWAQDTEKWPAKPAREYSQMCKQDSIARASWNVIHFVLQDGKISDPGMHGGGQNGTSSQGNLDYSKGWAMAKGLTSSSDHMSNQLEDTVVEYTAFVRYHNAAGVDVISMIVTMGECDDAQGLKNLTEAGVSYLDDACKVLKVPKDEYIKYCNHFGVLVYQ